MEELTTERTPHLIAAEINLIKNQINRIVLSSAIEIGRRLTEARNQFKYGEWTKWLAESVNFSKSTAEKMMRLYQEYGVKQLTLFNDGEPAGELANISYSQAYVLLGVPEEERAAFISETDLASMSTRALQKAVDDCGRAQQEKDRALEEKVELGKTLDKEKEKNVRLTEENTVLRRNSQELHTSKINLEKKVNELQSDINSIKKTSTYESVDRLRKDLTKASIKARANSIAFLYGELDRIIKELKFELKKIAADDPDTFVAYKNNVYELLVQRARDEMWDNS